MRGACPTLFGFIWSMPSHHRVHGRGGVETRIFHEPADTSGRQRDLFPLPCLKVESVVKKGLSEGEFWFAKLKSAYQHSCEGFEFNVVWR